MRSTTIEVATGSRSQVYVPPSTSCCRATPAGGTVTARPGTAAITCCRRSSRRPSRSRVIDGRLQLGTWQSICLVDTNLDNPHRTVRLSFLEG